MRKDRFTDEALRNAYALADLKYSENPEDQVAFEEAYDFARCQRPDGSFYGTSGQCRKGKDAGAKAEEPKKARAPKAAAAAPAAPKPTGFGGESVQQLKSEADAAWKRAREIGKKEAAAVAELRKDPQNKDLLRKVQVVQRERMNEDDRYRILTKKAKKLEKAEGAAAKPSGDGEPKPKKLKTDFRKDVEKGAAKRKAADEKRAARMTRDNELRGQIREGMAALKPVKAELDRRERAMKEVERRIKKDPSKENRANLRTLQRAVREQDRAVRKAEREIEKMAKERLRISKQNERERMTPAQRAEAARVRKIIKERG